MNVLLILTRAGNDAGQALPSLTALQSWCQGGWAVLLGVVSSFESTIW